MKHKIKICVLFGGESSEHEISCRSAQFLFDHLSPDLYETIPVSISKDGHWHILSSIPKFEMGIHHASYSKAYQLEDLGPKALFKKIFDLAPQENLQWDRHVVFPMLHGTFGEDGTIQGLCEAAGVAFVGSDCLGSAIAMNKHITKKLVEQAGISVVPHIYFDHDTWKKKSVSLLEDIEQLRPPYFVKPCSLGSSVGITKVMDKKDLSSAIEHALQYDSSVLVEEGLTQPRELECAMLGDSSFLKASAIAEIIPREGGFYTYEAKYLDPDGAKIEAPAAISQELTLKLQDLSCKVFQVCQLNGMARVDFFYDRKTNHIFFNEVNTIPGFTSISQYPILWKLEGLAGEDLCSELIAIAQKRGKQKALLKRSWNGEKSL